MSFILLSLCPLVFMLSSKRGQSWQNFHHNYFRIYNYHLFILLNHEKAVMKILTSPSYKSLSMDDEKYSAEYNKNILGKQVRKDDEWMPKKQQTKLSR